MVSLGEVKMTTSFCPYCGAVYKQEWDYCQECGMKMTGDDVLGGTIQINLTPAQIVGLLVLFFVTINVVNFLFYIFLPDSPEWVFSLPSLAVLVLAGVVLFGKDGLLQGGTPSSEEVTTRLSRWLGRRLNPYKPLKLTDRLGLLFGMFWSLVALFITVYAFLYPDFPLFKRRDLLVALVIFLPLIFDILNQGMKAVFGSSPAYRTVEVIKNGVSAGAFYYILSDWPFDVQGTISWVETNFIGEAILSDWWPSATITMDSLVAFVLHFVLLITILRILWDVFMLVVYLDVKSQLLGGGIATLVAYANEDDTGIT